MRRQGELPSRPDVSLFSICRGWLTTFGVCGLLLLTLMKVFVAAMAALLISAPTWCIAQERLLVDSKPPTVALDDSFTFRKIQQLFVSPEPFSPKTDRAVVFERNRILHGAVSEAERRQRYGHYYRFFWRANREADLTLRFEYRQANLGAFVQAREFFFPAAKGSIKSEFEIIGDDFENDGRVSAWRVLLIENGVVRAVEQSFLWK